MLDFIEILSTHQFLNIAEVLVHGPSDSTFISCNQPLAKLLTFSFSEGCFEMDSNGSFSS